MRPSVKDGRGKLFRGFGLCALQDLEQQPDRLESNGRRARQKQIYGIVIAKGRAL